MRDLQHRGGWVAACLLLLATCASAQTVIPIHTLEAGTTPASGSANPTYLAMTVVTTTGIVVDVVPNGFYLEAKTSTWNSPLSTTASEGIFVFTNGTPPPQAVVGNEVNVTGRLALSPVARVGALTVGTEINTGGSPAAVTLLTTGNSLPQLISLTTADTPTTGGFTPMLRYQGMRVMATQQFDTTGPTDGTIDESTETPTSNGIFYGVVDGIYAASGQTASYREPGVSVTEPALPAGAPAGVPRWDGNPEVLIFDSKSTGGPTAEVLGDSALATTLWSGAVDFQSGRATIMLDPATRNTGGVAFTPATSETAQQFSVGTLNVERFYSDLPSSGSASVTITSPAYHLRLQKLSLFVREAMFAPDILALQEVSTPTGNPNQTLLDIASQISTDAIAASQTDPQYTVGCIGTGNAITGLANAILYRPSKISLAAGACGEIGSNTLFDDLPLRMLATIKNNNYPVSVLNSELLARTNEDNTTATGASIRLQREEQAEYLSREISDEEQSNLHVIAVGDYNAFQFSDGYTDLVDVVKGTPPAASTVVQGTTSSYVQPNPAMVELALPDYENYSYSDNGVAVLLDHILASPELAGVGGVNYAQGNAFSPLSYFNALRLERTSDHDGLVAYFTPPVIAGELTGTVTASPEPSIYASSFTLTATVTPPSGSTASPTGTVTFFVDGVQLGTPVAITADTATSIATTTIYSIGSHLITAVYSGDTNYSQLQMSSAHTVSLIPTTAPILTLSFPVGSAPMSYGQDYNATVQPPQDATTPNLAPTDVPTGDISMTINGVQNCLLIIGGGICQNPLADAGANQPLQATYLGDATHAPSAPSNIVDLTVLQDTTTTTVSSSAPTAFQGQPATFTATVTASCAAPVGTVTFFDGGVQIGSPVTLNPGASGSNNAFDFNNVCSSFPSTATFTTSTLSVATHNITASYTPATVINPPGVTTTDFVASSTGPALMQQILPPVALPSTVTLTSSLNPAAFGQTVGFTAAIAVNPPPGNTVPLPTAPATGTVIFVVDGAAITPASMVNPATGMATFNTATLTVGPHTVVAQYSGDAFYLPGSSAQLIEVIHTVFTGPADFSLTIAQNPLVVGVGLPGSVAVTLVATNGWSNDVTLACPGNLPDETTCSLEQVTFPGGNGTTTLTLATTAPHNCGSSTPYFTGTAQLEMRFGSAALAGLLICLLPRRRRVIKGLLLAVLCVLPCVTGCAGNCTDLGTYPGTYTIPITATGVGTTTTHTVNLQMQVNL